MNSIAIWYEKFSDRESIPELDLHFNHWKLKYKKGKLTALGEYVLDKTLGRLFDKFKKHDNDYFLDIGLMISDGSSISQVCIYLPKEFYDKKTLIEDLGNKLTNKKVITAVFNYDYNICTTNSKIFPVNDASGNIKFNVYKLDTENDVTMTNSYGGTIIKFPFVSHEKPTYYRIRIKSEFVKTLSYVYKPKNSFLESASSSIEIIDFRVNDARNLDLSLIEHIQMKGKFKINLVHFLVMRKAEDEYILANDDLHSIRQLEENIWDKYIDHGHYKIEKVIAYHLKKKVSESIPLIDDFNGMLKFRFEDVKISRHLIWALIIAIIFELFGHFIFEYIKPFFF